MLMVLVVVLCCCVVGLEGVCLGWEFGWKRKGREGGWKAFVGEEKGVDWTGLGKKRWVHVCLEGQWHVNVTGQVRSRFRGTRLLSCDTRFFCGHFTLAFTSMRRMSRRGWMESGVQWKRHGMEEACYSQISI
jgi:hypothetical protein